jgi:hypothetical protein
MRKIKLIYQKQYDNFTSARKREIYLKTAAGRRFLKNKLSHKEILTAES